MLMHDGGADRAATIGLLSELIAKAKAAGYTFTTAASLVPAGYAPAHVQAFRKHRNMVLRPRYGVLGMIVLPYALLSVIVPLAFMPLTYVAAGLSIASGRWQNVALFAVFVAGVHLVISVVGVWMVRERLWHLLVVPVYRLVYEPLRGYVLYRSLVMAAKGKAMGWYRPARTGNRLTRGIRQ